MDRRVFELDAASVLIQKRRMAITKAVSGQAVEQTRVLCPGRARRKSRQQRMDEERAQTKHTVQVEAGKGQMRCTACRTVCNLKARRAIAWLKADCRPGPWSGPPAASGARATPFGRGLVDAPHRTGDDRGVVDCRACGAWALERPQILAKPCEGTATESRRKSLKRLLAGTRPKGMEQWPDER